MIQYGTGYAWGEASTDVLTLGDKKLDKLKFILVHQDESNEGIDGILGLCNYYNSLPEVNPFEFSLIDQLYNNNQINSKIFTQKYTENRKGKMFIGGLPDEIKNDMGNYGTCQTLKFPDNNGYGDILNHKWECYLKKFYFGDNTSYSQYEDHLTPVLFDTGTNIVLVPTEFFVKMEKTYFRKLIESRECEITKNDEEFYTFNCRPNVDINKLPNMNFLFGDWVITVKPEDLFHKGPSGSLQFLVTATYKLNHFIFGEPILKKYHMVFDKTKNVIGFYGTSDLNRFKYDLPNNHEYFLFDTRIRSS